jgi:N-glycosylase/DNA lyase
LNEAEIQHYFALDVDYKRIKQILRSDSVLSSAIDYASGIRVLRQPFFETLCSFIISQNNNITRITGIIERLCELCGELKDEICLFPTPQALSALTVEDLAPIRSGFRAKYLIDASVRCQNGLISEVFLKNAPLEDARRLLMTIKGVGPKVADCVLLFGCERYEAFPRDVWINRAMAALYPNGLPDFALPYAGIAQQYIFHNARTSGIFK